MQRMGQHTREAGPDAIPMERFMEALGDPESGLTHLALIGARKQCTDDVKKLFSTEMVAFMERNGYTAKADYIRVVCTW